MPVIIGDRQVVGAFDHLVNALDRRVSEFPYEIKTSVVREIVRTGSIDTTRMIQAVNYHEDHVTSSGQHFRVDTSDDDSVTYDGFVDQPGETRNWPGRFFYQRGIEGANIEQVISSIMNESFVT